MSISNTSSNGSASIFSASNFRRNTARYMAFIALLSVVNFMWISSECAAFTVGSHYDLLFNAFVEAPDGSQGLEGHSGRMLTMDGDPDFLPLTSAIPEDITNKTLVTMEQLHSTEFSTRSQSTISVLAQGGGMLVDNPLANDPFGLVTIVMSRLVWQDGTTDEGELLDPQVWIHENGEVRQSTAPIYVTGTGENNDPWRIITSIPGDEFGQATDRVDIVFDTVPEPESLALVLIGILGICVRVRR